MWNIRANNKNKILVATILVGAVSYAQAEVLVILPESGPMARAANSIKQGFMSAYQASGSKVPVKFVNSDQANMPALLKKNVNSKTQMIVGPLARADVDALIKVKPKLKVLSLNEGTLQANNVLQFSLAKKDDASALARVIKQDQIDDILVLRQPGTEAENELFLMALMSKTELPIHVLEQQPTKLKKGQALLFLGNNEWLLSLKSLPKKNIYTLSNALEQHKPLPLGIQFCDAPALFEADWEDMKHAYAQQPVGLPYQRLLAFGGDAWQITTLYLKTPKMKTANFEGRTGQLSLNGNQIQRTPHCYAYQAKGLKQV